FIDWWTTYETKKDSKSGLVVRMFSLRGSHNYGAYVVEFKNPTETGFHGKGSYLNANDKVKATFGKNYGCTPSICNGPCYNFKHDENEYLLEICHFKVHSDAQSYPYKKNSNIQNFREALLIQFSEHYKDQFTPHYGSPPDEFGEAEGFIYMAGFCLMKKTDQGISDVKFSDPFFPIELESTTARNSTVI